MAESSSRIDVVSRQNRNRPVRKGTAGMRSMGNAPRRRRIRANRQSFPPSLRPVPVMVWTGPAVWRSMRLQAARRAGRVQRMPGLAASVPRMSTAGRPARGKSRFTGRESRRSNRSEPHPESAHSTHALPEIGADHRRFMLIFVKSRWQHRSEASGLLWSE